MINKKHITIFFILFVAILVCCKKNKDNTIFLEGKIYDPNQNVYVSNALVTISSSSIQSGIYNSNYQDIKTATTDASGFYSLEIPEEKVIDYRLFIRKDKYFENTVNISPDVLIPGETYTSDYNLYPEAYIKLEVKNNDPFDSLDFIAYSIKNAVYGCPCCCSDSIYQGQGEDYEKTIKCKVYGSQYVVISGHVNKNGSDNLLCDSVYCTPFDTTTYLLYY